MRRLRTALFLLVILSGSSSASAASLVAELSLEQRATSNVYLDASQEWDIAFRPALELGIDFRRWWSAGYLGEANVYTRHTNLFSHWHRLYLFANPAWGEDGENEFLVELRLETLRNHADYAALNNLRPSLLTRLTLQAASWLTWNLEFDGAFRWFYDDAPANAFDGWLNTSFVFSLPSRTSLTPRLAYGVRRYTHQDTSITSDVLDQQLNAALRIGQGLWQDAGLQLEYGYLYAVGPSGLLLRKMTLEQFAYIGEEFLYSGHQAMVGFKQLLGEHWKLGATLAYQERRFTSWPIIDPNSGLLLNENRHDHRLTPRAYVEYAWWTKDETKRAVPEIHVGLEYFYMRQWSNSITYDTDAHGGYLSLSLSW